MNLSTTIIQMNFMINSIIPILTRIYNKNYNKNHQMMLEYLLMVKF
jgi:hypothetical protein